MLEIPDMEERSRLIFFMDGLERWVEQELKRRGVKTLAEAIAAAESLQEFQRDRNSRRGKEERKGAQDSGDEESEDESPPPRARTQGKGKPRYDSGSRDKGKRLECFLCAGPHPVRTCPQRQKLSAMVAKMDEESGATQRFGAMRLDGEVKLANMKISEEPTRQASETEETIVKRGGSLMTIDGEVNEENAKILVDTGATHNFLALQEAKKLGVRFTKVHGEMKAVNSRATPVYGRAWDVPIRLGKWKGKVDFLVVDMDEEGVILGMEFLRKVVPFKMGVGVMTITSKGIEYDIKLGASKESSTPRVSALRAKWGRQAYVRGRTRNEAQRSERRRRWRQS